MQTLSGVNLIFSGSLPRPKPRGVKVVLQFDPGYPLGCNVHLSCGPPLPTPHQPFSEWNEWPKHANKPTSIATARGAQLWGKLAPPRRKKNTYLDCICVPLPKLYSVEGDSSNKGMLSRSCQAAAWYAANNSTHH